MRATDHAVVIAGGGPTGLMLAGELALAGADVAVVERRADASVEGRRAGGLHVRTLEVLDQRGIVERFVAEGQRYPAVGFAYNQLDLSDFPTRHPYLLALWQSRFEPILTAWVEELGVPIQREREVVGLVQDPEGVDVELSDGASLRSAYLVGCDGGRSIVRKAAGIGFPGLDATASWVIADVQLDEQPPLGVRPEGGGIGPGDPADGTGVFGVVVREERPDHAGPPTTDDLRAALRSTYGTDFGMHEPLRVSRFSDASRQAAAYRSQRVLLAGDAAHVHPPQGGQGLNVGVQDAVNLGWKLARVVAGTAPEGLLDTYHAERHPVGARVQHNTQAQVALATDDERHQALRETVAELLATDEARRRIAGMMSGLDVRYDLGGSHPLVGRRMPDLDLTTADGATTVFALLHGAQPVLILLGTPGATEADPSDHRVRVVAASCDGPWELPVIGIVDAPDAVLVRPDGHVAWVGSPDDPELLVALERWFGPATSSSSSRTRLGPRC